MDLKDLKRLTGALNGRKPRKRGGKAKFRAISNDQVCVLVARDRQRTTYSGILGRGRIRTSKLDEAIGVYLTVANVLCTDSWREFSSFANKKGLSHYRFKSDGKQRVKGIYHIENVNSYITVTKTVDGPFQRCGNQISAKLLGMVPLFRQQGI